MTEPVPAKELRTRVLYLSPLRALAHDIDKNLRAPLEGIAQMAEAQLAGETQLADKAQQAGETARATRTHMPTIGVRTGDTSPAQRRRLVTKPPDILITTPESLYLMLTSRARETLSAVRWVIVDEIHSVAATKRGTHLAVSLERLCLRTEAEPQRIALSATQRPLSQVAEFLGGSRSGDPAGSRPVKIVDVSGTADAGTAKKYDIEVIVPDRDMGDLAGSSNESDTGTNINSIWPAIHPQLLELILTHHSTIIFVNGRRLAERLASRLNELYTHGINRAAEGTGTAADSPVTASPVAEGTGADSAAGPGTAASKTALVRAHHGSLSRELRLEIESALKAGTLRAIVSTSSLELGIDMGAVDLVVQVESPGSVAAGMQRIGRAGHQVGAPSVGKIFPSHRSNLVESAVVVQRMQAGLIEQTQYPRLALDVLAQHIVAMVAMDDWNTDEMLSVLRRAAPYHRLSQSVFESVLDLLAGRYPSQEFAELRPRIVWDRLADTIRPRQGAGTLAVTNGGTIADRGLYSVFTLTGSRVGELDEEMVYEARAGETFLLGASSWRIEEITHDRVLVSPAPGVPAKMPFWHGGGPGRPLELGRAVGAFMRETVDALPPVLPPALALELKGAPAANGSQQVGAGAELEPLPPLELLIARLQKSHGLNRCAAINLLLYLDEQRAATGAIPDDRTIVVESFRDELGDWRICVLTPFGSQVHAPWAIAMQSLLESGPAGTDAGRAVDILWNDDGIVLRLPDTEQPDTEQPDTELGTAEQPDAEQGNTERPDTEQPDTEQGTAELDYSDPVSLVSLDPDTVTDTIVSYLPSTALFASRFREVAGRALLLPRRRPGERTPLWQQRQRASSLLEVAAKYPSFPMLLETTRECLQDVFNVPALVEVLRDITTRKVRVVAVGTQGASPMAQGLLFDWTAVFMYSGDMPLAERRAAALSLNQELLADLLGPQELRELLDPEVLTSLASELANIRAKDADQLHDELRRLGDLTAAEIVSRHSSPAVAIAASAAADAIGNATADPAHDTAHGPAAWLAELAGNHRICEIQVGGQPRWIIAEDGARYSGALGCELPAGLPAALVAPTPDTTETQHLAELVARFAATHGPFEAQEAAARFGVSLNRTTEALERLADSKRVVSGAFKPAGTQSEWCDAEVLRILRRRSLARLRRAIKPVAPSAYGRFLPIWHGLDRPRAGPNALADAINMLGGTPLVASTLEADVLPARVRDYQPGDIDALLSSGDLIWVGAGSLGSRDGRVRLYWRDDFAMLAAEPTAIGSDGAEAVANIHDTLRQVLLTRGSAFWPELLEAAVASGGGASQSGGASQMSASRMSASQVSEAALVALWDLVWAGEITNDTLSPLRALLTGAGATRSNTSRSNTSRSNTPRKASRPNSQHRRGPSFVGPRPARRRMRLSNRDLAPRARTGMSAPLAATGRWSSTAAAYLPRPAVTERAHYNSLALLDRQGVLTRAGVLAEQQPGGFASVYALMRALEERGGVRRGYFIEGLGGSQFASPEAVEMLRSLNQPAPDQAEPAQPEPTQPAVGQPAVGPVLVLAATDPAQPYGAAIPWPASPGRPTRSAGSHVVLADGVPLVQLDRGGRGLQTFAGSEDVRWIEALRQRIQSRSLRSQGRTESAIEIRKIDGQRAATHPLHDWLIANGFVAGYRGPTLN